MADKRLLKNIECVRLNDVCFQLRVGKYSTGNVVGPRTALIIVWSEGEPHCCAVDTKTINWLLYHRHTTRIVMLHAHVSATVCIKHVYVFLATCMSQGLL